MDLACRGIDRRGIDKAPEREFGRESAKGIFEGIGGGGRCPGSQPLVLGSGRGFGHIGGEVARPIFDIRENPDSDRYSYDGYSDTDPAKEVCCHGSI